MALSRQNITKKNWESIFTDRGNVIFRLIFITFISQEEIREKLQHEYKKKCKRNVDKQILSNFISNYLNAWEDLKYLNKVRVRNPNSKSKSHPNTNLYLANLNVLFDYCNKKKKIIFSEQERDYLKWLLLNDRIRKDILKEYPDEDIINATLKYYVKNIIIKYNFLLRDIYENPDKYKEEYKKVEKLNNPKTEEEKEIIRQVKKIDKDISKRFNLHIPKEKKLEFSILQAVIHSKYYLKNPSDFLLMEYFHKLEDNYKVVLSVDEKILNAIGLYPMSLVQNKK